MGSVYDIPFWSNHFYDHKARWIHYYNQVCAVASEIRKRNGDVKNFKVLEVGPSHGMVTSYLRKFGVDIITIDIKKEYNPDVLGSVLEMPFADNSFDMIIICEVLEHMPYDLFPKALGELHRVARGAVLISVPDVRRILLGLDIKLPFIKRNQKIIKIPTFRKQILKKKGAHYWEIGNLGYSLRRIRNDIEKANFDVVKEKTFIDTPKNYYFFLNKR